MLLPTLFAGVSVLTAAEPEAAAATPDKSGRAAPNVAAVDSEAQATEAKAIVITAAPLPKYRVTKNDAGTLVDMKPEKVPFVVDTLTEDFIRERNVTDVDQLLSLQPGIFQNARTPNARDAGKYRIRGFSGSEVIMNGVPLMKGVATFLDPSLLERVDIVKGPVGGAYGGQSSTMSDREGAAGSVLLQTKRAVFNDEFHDFTLRGSYSKPSGSRAKFMMDVNETFGENDNVAIRLPLAYEWSEPGNAASGARHGTVYSAAPSISLMPAERLELGLDLFYQYRDMPAYQGINLRYGKPVSGGWDGTVCRDQDRMKFKVYGGTFRADGEVNDWLTLRTRLAMYQGHNESEFLAPGRTAPSLSGDDCVQTHFYGSQEAILKHDLGDVEGQFLAGINYTYMHRRDRDESPASTSHHSKLGINSQELLEWKGLSLILGLRADYHQNPKGETAWAYSPRMGLSYDIAEKGLAILFANVSLTDVPNFNQETWTVGKGRKTYLRSGQYMDNTWRAVQKEAGLRVNPVGSLWLTGTVFRIDQSNAPMSASYDISDSVADSLGLPHGVTYTESHANDKEFSQGIEFSASGNITDNLSMYFAYTYIDYCRKTQHQRFDRFPPHSASLWLSYKAPWFYDAVIGFGARYRDDWLLTMFGKRNPSDFTGGYKPEECFVKRLLTFDASLDFPVTDNFSIGCALRNIFNERGVESARHYYQCFVNEGRTFELSLRYRF